MIWVGHAAIHRAYQGALGFIEEAHTFRALLGINLVDLIPFGDGLIRALWLTGTTSDALFSDHISHYVHLLPTLICSDWKPALADESPRATAKLYKACPNWASDRYFTTAWRFCQISGIV